MLGLDRRAASITWTVFVIGLLIALAWFVRSAITIFLIALFLAYMLYPLVRLVERITPPRFPQVASLAIVYAVLLSIVIIFCFWMGSRLVDEAQSLGEQLPKLIERGTNLESVPVPGWLEPYKERLVAIIREQTANLANRIGPLLQSAVGGVAGVLGSLGYTLLIPILSFLFLKDANNIRDYLLGWVPGRQRQVTAEILDDVHKLLAEYIRALVILSALTLFSYSIFFQLIGLQYSFLISAAASILEFIPYIGPLLGTVVILLVAAFTGFPHILWILFFFAAYRAVQDYLIQPNLMAAGTQLHPLAVFFGAFAGEALGGLWGMFLSVPVLAAVRIILVRVYKHRSAMPES
jgi:predicted PurR-regulated permease PerM